MPSRLRVGVGIVAAMAAACVIGPFLRSPLPSDPVHASLLPPLTRVTVLNLDDGTTIVAPRISRKSGTTMVAGLGRRTLLEPDRIVSEHEYRFWCGSDRFGRDVLYQLLTGGRISLSIAALAMALALAVGGAVGVMAATGGRWADAVLMRFVDAVLAFPVLFLMVLAAALTRPDPALLVVLLGLTSWMGVARLVRGQLLTLRNRPFIAAATVSGSSPLRIASRPAASGTAQRLTIFASSTTQASGSSVPPSV